MRDSVCGILVSVEERSSGPLHAEDLTVALDYGQFYLVTGYLDDGADPVSVVDAAIAGDGIAQHGPALVVLSPHQNNFAMPLRVEQWPAEPPDDLDAWDEAYTAWLEINERGLVFESPTLNSTSIAVPPGTYAVRITGKDFVNRGWPGSTKPGDSWRLQFWPHTEPFPAQRLRRWSG